MYFSARTFILLFSNEKIVEEIVSCYDLLVICGSQITISRVGAKGTQQGLPPGYYCMFDSGFNFCLFGVTCC